MTTGAAAARSASETGGNAGAEQDGRGQRQRARTRRTGGARSFAGHRAPQCAIRRAATMSSSRSSVNVAGRLALGGRRRYQLKSSTLRAQQHDASAATWAARLVADQGHAVLDHRAVGLGQRAVAAHRAVGVWARPLSAAMVDDIEPGFMLLTMSSVIQHRRRA